MRKIKIMIFVFIIIIISLICALLLISKDNNHNNTLSNSTNNIVVNINTTVNYIEEAKTSATKDIAIIDSNIKAVTSSTKFYTVSNCVQKYFDTISNKNKSELYAILNSDYITSKGITEENVLSYVHTITTSSNFTALEMNVLEGMNTEVYSVYGTILDKNKTGIGEDVFFIVDLSRHNLTFSITPLIGNSYSNIKQIDIVNEDIMVEKNDYNKFSYYKITDEELIRRYISNYKINAIYNTKESYNLLDEEYRIKRFGSLNEYQEYIKENVDTIKNSILKTYDVTEENGITRYDYIDNNGNHYLFKETAVMQYTVFLDDYTILTDEGKEEYNELDKFDKAKHNLTKFIKMINSKDYNGIYNVLDNTFKSNNFKNVESLKKYIEENAYKYNDIEIEEYDDTTYDYIVFNCNLINFNNEKEVKSITIIINQMENGNFTMSFSFN